MERPTLAPVSKLSIVIITDTQKSVKSKSLFSVQFKKQYIDKSIYAIIKPALTITVGSVALPETDILAEALSIMEITDAENHSIKWSKKIPQLFLI